MIVKHTFPGFFNELLAETKATQTPAANISENEDGFELKLAVPGFAKENFKIEIQDKALKISVADESVEKTEEYKVVSREFTLGAFTRVFRLPNTIDSEGITAQYEQGILTLSIPKKEEAKPKEPRLLEIA